MNYGAKIEKAANIEFFIFGASEDVEAEYGQRAPHHPYTLLTLVNDEAVCCEGFDTLLALQRELAGVSHKQIERLG